MSKPYDATLKQLMDAFAADWVAVLAPLIGLSSTVEVEPLDADPEFRNSSWIRWWAVPTLPQPTE